MIPVSFSDTVNDAYTRDLICFNRVEAVGCMCALCFCA